MNLSKVQEFFDYSKINMPVHIIGCGAIGSTLCDQLARIGVTNFHLYDFDHVEPHNISNQNFLKTDIGKEKVKVCAEMIMNINEDATVIVHPEGLQAPYTIPEGGLICLCVDSIELRRDILVANQYNPTVHAFTDFRMRLTDAQHYLAVRSDSKKTSQLLASMNFSHEDAVKDTPVSACGIALSVRYTVETIVALGVANIVKMWQKNDTHFLIVNNMLTPDIVAM